ncbi:MAG TPA: hypothetical protein VMV46_04615 [Thermoanaerobaculia bacterium]|nr:hypothetical protein [Thermoanaerobaculia bacterium]
MRRASRLGSIVAGILLALAPAATRGDDVHLENGRVFEEVVATVTESHVVIEMAHGRLRLPRAQVLRVEQRETPLQTFRERRAALLAASRSPAESWAELARWAWAHGLGRDAVETALRAVRLDPEVGGLDGMLRQQGFERDPELGWVPLAVAMERRGLVSYRGEWVTPERRAALEAEAEAEAEARAAAERRARSERDAERAERAPRAAGPTANEVALASIDLAREVATGRMGVTIARASGLGSAYPVFIPQLTLSGGGGLWVGGDRHGIPRDGDDPRLRAALAHRARVAADWEALASRIPGSRLPLSAFQPQPKQ